MRAALFDESFDRNIYSVLYVHTLSRAFHTTSVIFGSYRPSLPMRGLPQESLMLLCVTRQLIIASWIILLSLMKLVHRGAMVGRIMRGKIKVR